jgi:hypothetical protein
MVATTVTSGDRTAIAPLRLVRRVNTWPGDLAGARIYRVFGFHLVLAQAGGKAAHSGSLAQSISGSVGSVVWVRPFLGGPLPTRSRVRFPTLANTFFAAILQPISKPQI